MEDTIQPRRAGRFSDRLEYRRGLRDGSQGRAPACMVAGYLSGYSQGRRAARSARSVSVSASREKPAPSPSLTAAGAQPAAA